jgi:ABC-type uncharacterized transport system, permease component
MINLYLEFIKIKLRAMTEYPVAFWTDTFAKMIGWAANLAVVFLMVFNFKKILGWSSYEVLLLFAINATSYALAGFFMFNAFGMLPMHIQMGTFDEILTKPINPFFYLCFKGFATDYIGNLIATVIAVIICIVKLDITMSLINILYLVVIIIGAALIHCGMFMFASIPVFWLIKADALLSFKWALDQFIIYPISIYDRWIQIMLTFVFPIAFVNFYPLQYFLKKGDLSGFSPVIAYLTPVIGIILFTLGYLFFNAGIRNYKSTGS